jgi:hypothetical protein
VWSGLRPWGKRKLRNKRRGASWIRGQLQQQRQKQRAQTGAGQVVEAIGSRGPCVVVWDRGGRSAGMG